MFISPFPFPFLARQLIAVHGSQLTRELPEITSDVFSQGILHFLLSSIIRTQREAYSK